MGCLKSVCFRGPEESMMGPQKLPLVFIVAVGLACQTIRTVLVTYKEAVADESTACVRPGAGPLIPIPRLRSPNPYISPPQRA